MYSKANKKYYEPDIDYPSESAITVYALCPFLQRDDEKVCLSCTCALMEHGYSRLLKVMYLIVFYQIHTTFAYCTLIVPSKQDAKNPTSSSLKKPTNKNPSYHKRVVFIDRSPAECYNSSRVLWIGEKSLP